MARLLSAGDREADPVLPTLLSIVAAVAVVFGAIGGISWTHIFVWAALVLGGLVVLVFGFNLALFIAFGFLLGAAPTLQIPIVNVSAVFALAAMAWLAAVAKPRTLPRVQPIDAAFLTLIVVSAVSLAATADSVDAIRDFIRWSIATAVVFPLRLLSGGELRRVGKAFVVGTCFAALAGIALLRFDASNSFVARLTILGYSPLGGNARVVVGTRGSANRLVGTYIDPNLGGFMLVIGLIIAVALLRGWSRILVGALLLFGIVLTLSRSAMGSVALAAIVLILLSRIALKYKVRLCALGVLASASFLLIPSVRYRLIDSFGPSDTGSTARRSAFEVFPHEMAGHWLFGKGWGLPELLDASAATTANNIANSPLLSVYRGGVIVGAVFVLMLVLGLSASWRLARQPDFSAAVVGSGFIGLTAVALQLDFTIVTLLPATMAFALLVAFVAGWDSGKASIADPMREAASHDGG